MKTRLVRVESESIEDGELRNKTKGGTSSIKKQKETAYVPSYKTIFGLLNTQSAQGTMLCRYRTVMFASLGTRSSACYWYIGGSTT